MSATNGHVLGDVASFVRGITFTPEDLKPPFEEGTAVCMRTKNVQVDLDEEDLIAVPKVFVRRKEQYLSEGDLLVSSANSWNLVGKCCWVPKLNYEATAGGFISILRADRKRIVPRYLYHWFAAPQTQHEVRLCGRQTTNISNLNYERCLNLPIPLPKLDEQKRIAAILDKADAIRRQRQEAQTTADKLTESVFMTMFGTVKHNPSSIPSEQLGKLVKVKSGDFLPQKNMNPTGIHPVYGGNGVNGHHDQYMFEDRKIVIGRVGVYCGAVHYTEPRSWITDNALYVAEVLADLCPLYLVEALRFANLNQYASQSGQPLISASRINRAEILLPSATSQQVFAKAVECICTMRNRLADAWKHSDALFNSLVQRAFKGEL